MTNRALFLKHGYIYENAPLLNGLGRFIPQLQRVTIKFCKESPPSFGVRQFIEHDLVEFAEANPHVAIYLKPRRHRSPVLVGEYLNGQRYWQSVWDYSRDRVSNWMDVIRSASGREFQQQDKHHYTDNPTIQGMWHSYVNTEPHVALAKFPDPELGGPLLTRPSASQQLQDLLKRQEEIQRKHANLSQSERDKLEEERQS